MTRAEDADPGLPTRIRQLARKGLTRVEIFEVLRDEGRVKSFVMLNKVIRRCSITVASPSRTQDRMALARARADVAQEISAAKSAAIVTPPFKSGDLQW